MLSAEPFAGLDLPGRVDAQPERASQADHAGHRATHAIAAAIGGTREPISVIMQYLEKLL